MVRHRPSGLYEAAGRRRGEQRTLILLGIIGLALAMILGAFFLGRVFAEQPTDAGGPDGDQGESPRVEAGSLAEAAVGGQPPATALPRPVRTTRALTGEPYGGPVERTAAARVRASCRAAPRVDAGGRRTAYPPANVLDGVPTTAWRCPGDGHGHILWFDLGRKKRLVAVGIIPGYAKVDPFNGADRYAENRRIASVRWSFDGGRYVDQTFHTGPGERDIQTRRIPAVSTRTVTLTITGSRGSRGGRRDTVAISEAALFTPVR